MRKDPSYLARMHMCVIGGHDEDIDPRSIDWAADRSPNFTIRQDSGNWNALGNLKIDMPKSLCGLHARNQFTHLFADDYG